MAKTFYITKKQLEDEIILSKKKYRESNEPRTPAECFTPKLTEYLILLVNRYANKGQWRNYSYLSDMKSDALTTLCQNCFKYDETRFDNPFGYLTQIVKYCFITFLEKEQLMRDIKDSLWESVGMTPSYTRQIKNAMLRDVVDQSNKGMKSLKKAADIINLKIDILGNIIFKIKKLDIPDSDIDIEISEALDIKSLHYTGDIDAVTNLFVNPPDYQIEADIEIADQRVNCLTVFDATTTSNTKRIINNTNSSTIILALCAIALTIRRDMLVKKVRDISGYNITSTQIPTADKMNTMDFEYESENFAVPELQTPKRKTKLKSTTASPQ